MDTKSDCKRKRKNGMKVDEEEQSKMLRRRTIDEPRRLVRQLLWEMAF